jgi:hypothetical protein
MSAESILQIGSANEKMQASCQILDSMVLAMVVLPTPFGPANAIIFLCENSPI